jgi:DNA uptake protein ComE-like DNA-binding protein
MNRVENPENQQGSRGAWVSRSQTLGAILMAVALVAGLSIILVQQLRTGSGVEVVRTAESGPIYRVNVNRADAPELMLLPGIGEVRAERILNARGESGRFGTFQEFGAAAGLSESQVAEIEKVATLGEAAARAED